MEKIIILIEILNCHCTKVILFVISLLNAELNGLEYTQDLFIWFFTESIFNLALFYLSQCSDKN